VGIGGIAKEHHTYPKDSSMLRGLADVKRLAATLKQSIIRPVKD
jgi:hypothetical protein